MVFQSYALYPHMTVRQNMAFSLTVRRMGRDEIESRVAEAARRLGLSEMLDRYPKQLSGGQRQRVAVGRAIVRQPRAFLFDEPLSNLDAALRGQMRIELKTLHRELDATMVYVTHDQVEAMTLADRIALLEGGYARQVGTPAELYERPSSKFVAGFIGSPPMNFLEGTFDPGKPGVSGDGFDLDLPGEYLGLEARGGVIVGIRPNELSMGGGRPGSVTGTVEVLETLGWESYVHVAIGGQQVIAQAESTFVSDLKPGSTVTFTVNPSAVHLFDTRTEEALRPGR
jgi:multiple sugar transport system ATP-binding protein